MLDQLINDAEKNFVSMFVCGGSPDPYPTLLPWLQAQLDPGSHYIAVPQGGDTDAYLRACMRQDPDGVLVDQSGMRYMPLLLNIICTGHRLVAGHPQQPPEAFEAILAGGGELPAGVVGQILEKSLLLAVNDQAQITAVYQVQPSAQLVLVAQLNDQAWHLLNPAYWGKPIQTLQQDFSPIEVPDHWTPLEIGLLESLRILRKPKMRPSWAPILEASSTQQHSGSHFGGVAALLPGESWPCCQDCQKRMLLVAQIESRDLPTHAQELLGPGTLQLFYCVDDACSVDEAWAPFAGNSLSRLISSQGLVAPSADDQFLPPAFPCHQVQSWVELQEGPDWQESDSGEVDALGYTQDWAEIVTQSSHAEGLRQQYSKLLEHFKVEDQDLAEIVALSRNYRGDKLFGWPSWSQGAEYPKCRQCNTRMQMVLQINNDGHKHAEPGYQSCFGQIFASDGNGHIFRCRNHPQEMTFCWACG